MWWFSNRVFGLHKLASRFRIVKEECHQCVVVVVAQCCLCSHLLLAAFSTKTDYVFRKTHRFLYIFEFLSTVPAWSFGKCFCHLPVTLQNLSRDLVSLRGRVLTYPRVYSCGWLFFFLITIHLRFGFGFSSATIGNLENLLSGLPTVAIFCIV